MASKALLQAIAVCAELTQTQLSEAAARVFAADLSQYPEDQVLAALTRCRRELKGRLTLGAVIERLDDGRPGPEEAFALLPRDESASVVWTEEMAEAAVAASPHFEDGDTIAARMAFRETYQRALQRARDARRPVRWTASWGWDVRGRELAVVEAVARGRITAERASKMLPELSAEALVAIGLPAPVEDRVGLRKLAALQGGERAQG